MIVHHHTGKVHICDFCGMSSLGNDIKMTTSGEAVICKPCAITAVEVFAANSQSTDPVTEDKPTQEVSHG